MKRNKGESNWNAIHLCLIRGLYVCTRGRVVAARDYDVLGPCGSNNDPYTIAILEIAASIL